MPLKALRGDISYRDLRDECLIGISDVESFVGWCVDRIPSVVDLTKQLRETGSQGVGLVEELRNELTVRVESADRFLDEIARASGSEDEKSVSIMESVRRKLRSEATGAIDLRKLRHEELVSLYKENRSHFTQRHVGEEAWRTYVLRSSIGALPGFDTFVEVAALHFVANTHLQDMKRKPLRSDIADILHCIYLPYVDVFRTDRYMATIAKEIAAKHGTIVATSLSEAVRIAERLASERCSIAR